MRLGAWFGAAAWSCALCWAGVAAGETTRESQVTSIGGATITPVGVESLENSVGYLQAYLFTGAAGEITGVSNNAVGFSREAPFGMSASSSLVGTPQHAEFVDLGADAQGTIDLKQGKIRLTAAVTDARSNGTTIAAINGYFSDVMTYNVPAWRGETYLTVEIQPVFQILTYNGESAYNLAFTLNDHFLNYQAIADKFYAPVLDENGQRVLDNAGNPTFYLDYEYYSDLTQYDFYRAAGRDPNEISVSFEQGIFTMKYRLHPGENLVSTNWGVGVYTQGHAQAQSFHTTTLTYFLPEGVTVSSQMGFGNFEVLSPAGAVPEPSTWATMLLGFVGAGTLLRRQRRRFAEAWPSTRP